MRLGELLVQAGKISTADLQEALEAQVIHGGRLGTNLLELGLVEEKDLAAALGKLHGVQHAAGKMAPEPRVLATVEADFCDEHDVVPMRMDATRLSVAVINPGDLTTLDALAFKTGRRVIPVVVPEFRMNQLLRTHCKAFRSLRAIDLEGPRKREVAQAGGPPATELMSEEEFQSLYAQVLAGDGAPEAVGHAPVEVGSIASAGPHAPDARTFEPPPTLPTVVRAIPTRPAAAQSPQLPHAPQSSQSSQLPHSPQSPNSPQPSQPSQPHSPHSPHSPGPAGAPAPRPPAPVVPLLTPLSFQEAQARLAQSDDREAIAQTVLRFAAGKWKRVLLLSVQRDLVLGWHGLGPHVRENAVRRMAIPLRPGNTFRLVRDTRAHFVGPLKRDAATLVFFQLLGGGLPTTAVMLPLLVRGKVVHLLYVDNGPDQLTTPDVGELMILSQSVARSYETLIASRARG